MNQIHIIITGLVQGIGFRYFAVREAKALGITGNVRNLPDGSVEVNAQGEKTVLDEFVTLLKEGPSSGTVKEVKVEKLVPGRKFETFSVEC